MEKSRSKNTLELQEGLPDILERNDTEELERLLGMQQTYEEQREVYYSLATYEIDGSHLDLVKTIMEWHAKTQKSSPDSIYAFLQTHSNVDFLQAAIDADIPLGLDSNCYPEGFLGDMINEIVQTERDETLPLLEYLAKPENYEKTDLPDNDPEQLDRLKQFLAARRSKRDEKSVHYTLADRDKEEVNYDIANPI